MPIRVDQFEQDASNILYTRATITCDVCRLEQSKVATDIEEALNGMGLTAEQLALVLLTFEGWQIKPPRCKQHWSHT